MNIVGVCLSSLFQVTPG